MEKYELTNETITVYGRTLYRIRALVSIERRGVKAGDLGGFVEKKDNLRKDGNAWVSGNARVSGNAWVSGDAQVSGNAQVSGDAQVYGNAQVYGDAQVSGNALVSGDARVYGDAQVYGNAQVSGNAWVYGDAQVYGNAQVSGNAWVSRINDYIVFKNWWSSGRYFTWTRSNDMWIVGCFHGTGKELIERAYRDSEKSGREYEKIVNYVEEIKSTINNQSIINQ